MAKRNIRLYFAYAIIPPGRLESCRIGTYDGLWREIDIYGDFLDLAGDEADPPIRLVGWKFAEARLLTTPHGRRYYLSEEDWQAARQLRPERVV